MNIEFIDIGANLSGCLFDVFSFQVKAFNYFIKYYSDEMYNGIYNHSNLAIHPSKLLVLL